MNTMNDENAMGVPTADSQTCLGFSKKVTPATAGATSGVAARLQRCRLLSHGFLKFVGLE
jgi:hypothetical protein